MAWSATAEHERFDEAVAFFASRVPYTRAQYDALDDKARAQAFYISGGLEIEAVQTVFDEINKSIANGEPLEAFKKRVREKLEGKLGPDGFHLDTVFRNAVQNAYNTGRWYQLTDPELTLLRPYLLYDSVLDDRTTDVCRALDGTCKAHDDPFWLTHHPLMHHRCRASLRSLRTKEAQRRGITTGEPMVNVPEGWGTAPPLRGDETLKPKAARFDPEVWEAFTKRDAQAMGELDVAQGEAEEKRAKRKLRDPATYKEREVAEYQEAGPAVAWGKAVEQRGLDLKVGKACGVHDRLVRAGMNPSADSRFAVDEALGRLGATTVAELEEAYKTRTLGDLLDAVSDEEEAAAHILGLASLAGHVSSITPVPLDAIGFRDMVELPGARLTEAQMVKAAKRMARFYAAVCDASVQQPKAVTLYSDERTRPEYHFTSHKFFAGRGTLAQMVHEWGHALDEANDPMAERALAFRRARTAGRALVPLSELDKRGTYEADEAARLGGFYHPYMGKEYGSSPLTEVTTMAFQALATESIGVLRLEDPSTLYFALGQLAGRKLP